MDLKLEVKGGFVFSLCTKFIGVYFVSKHKNSLFIGYFHNNLILETSQCGHVMTHPTIPRPPRVTTHPVCVLTRCISCVITVLDMSRHTPLYRALLELLRALSVCSPLIPLLLPQDGESVSISELLDKMKACVDTYASRLR